MEGRVVPTTFHAANVAQLIVDIQAANNNPTQANTIILANRNYILPSELQIQNQTNLTIKGGSTSGGTANPATVNIIAPHAGRVLDINGGNVTIQGVTLTGGNNVEQGGGIFSQNANLSIQNSSITGNAATSMGGGVFAQGGTVKVAGSTVNGNISNALGGGIASINADVTITNSAVNNNSAINGNVGPDVQALNSGGGIYAQGGSVTILGGAVTNNRAFASTFGTTAASLGGGVSTVGTTVFVNQSRIQDNSLNTIASQVNPSLGSAFATQGGSLTITNSTLARNGPSRQFEFYHPDAKVVLKNSNIEGRNLSGSFIVTDTGIIPGS